MEKSARAGFGTKKAHPVELAYWRIRHPHKLYINGCGMKNEYVIWVLEICPTPWGGVGGENVIFSKSKVPYHVELHLLKYHQCI